MLRIEKLLRTIWALKPDCLLGLLVKWYHKISSSLFDIFFPYQVFSVPAFSSVKSFIVQRFSICTFVMFTDSVHFEQESAL